ncbi:Alpha/Beta hydrolase protein [Halteromyces radiatus]|uniref:Alpha/Beta hydrolase protein n=1 Tax=Halteromyces radiatus TaxID=101107 RepID=UPI002220B371|nr:Alpha/Beta hydrolase protein [Halteromyces radiatus]KAI8086621.1 Alpha/Beta hydrolase protein [Halteromyces radiatus]
MPLDKNDPSTFNHKYATVNGIRMHYVDENSSSQKPLLLIHGWPDLWLGWREQIPFLVELGYRVIVPSLRGFGETEAPESHEHYGMGVISQDLLALMDHLALPTVTVLAHDWGGAVAWRFAQFYPDRVLAVGSFCTPYSPPARVHIPLEKVVEVLPNFKYQLYLVTPEAEKDINENTANFFARIFRPIAEASKDPLIDPQTGTLQAGRSVVPKSDVISQKVFDYYVKAYQQAGARGGLNWYKQSFNNYNQCKDLPDNVTQPALMVVATLDRALPPSMSEKMSEYIPNLDKLTVEGAGHWVLWERPTECNDILKSWLTKVYPIESSPKL